MPALDGWRGIAVLGVVGVHTNLLSGGWLGVELFFVLSGFLITRVLLRDSQDNDGKISLRLFWWRRVRRLIPALVVFFAGCAALVALTPNTMGVTSQAPRQFTLVLAYLDNWFEASINNFPSAFFDHMWSLSVEEQFYIAYPLVLVAVAAAKNRSTLLWALLGTTVFSWFLGVSLSLASPDSFLTIYFSTFTRIGAITFGGLLGALTAFNMIHFGRIGRYLSYVSACAAFIVVAMTVATRQELVISRWWLVVIFDLACGVVLLFAASPQKVGVNRIVSMKPLLWIGSISYGLYLWHMPTSLLLKHWFSDSAPGIILFVATLALSCPVAYASFRWIETPIRSGGFRSLRMGRRVIHPAVTGVAALLIISVTYMSFIRASDNVTEQQNLQIAESEAKMPPDAGAQPPSP